MFLLIAFTSAVFSIFFGYYLHEKIKNFLKISSALAEPSDYTSITATINRMGRNDLFYHPPASIMRSDFDTRGDYESAVAEADRERSLHHKVEKESLGFTIAYTYTIDDVKYQSTSITNYPSYEWLDRIFNKLHPHDEIYIKVKKSNPSISYIYILSKQHEASLKSEVINSAITEFSCFFFFFCISVITLTLYLFNTIK
jgi:hypothetical protein